MSLKPVSAPVDSNAVVLYHFQQQNMKKVKTGESQKIQDAFDRSYQAQVMDHRAFYTSWSQYSVIFINDKVAKWDDADFILLGEKHGSEACRRQSGCLIADMARKSSVTFLLEGVPSMQVIEDSDKASWLAQAHCIDSAAGLRMCGWDNKDFSEGRFGLSTNDFLLAERSVRETQEEIRRQTSDLAPIEKYLNSMDESFLLSLPLESLRNIFELKKAYKREFEYLKFLYEDLAFFRKQVSLGIMTDEGFLNSFPKRTQSMVATLKKLEKMLKLGEIHGKIILIAGTLHLKTPEFHQETAKFDLSPLYQWLKQHKTVVMMPPDSTKFLSCRTLKEAASS